MIILSTSELSFSVGERDIIKNVSFSANEGDKIGIIGVNGAGKTTLFRLISGEYEATSGEVFLARGASVGVLKQDSAESGVRDGTPLLESMYGTFPELLRLEEEIALLEGEVAGAQGERLARLSADIAAARERFYEDGGLEFRTRCRSMLQRVGFAESELDLPLSSLSGGQHTRLSLARLLLSEPDILMLDEPTNHLDIDALDWLEDFLANYKKTVLIISHDRYFLDSITNKTLKIERCEARLYPGNYTEARALEDAERAATLRAHKEQQKVIAKIEANIEFQRRCGQEHNFVTIRSKQHQLDKIKRIAPPPPPPPEIRLAFNSDIASGNEVITARRLSFSYGEKELLRELSFLVRRGERVLLLGANGCGKSTLLRLVLGELSAKSGCVELGYNVRVGYYDQENRELHDRKTVMEELHDEYPARTDLEIRSVLALFLFRGEDVNKTVSNLSGGERARLTLAKMMMKKTNLLVLDEPTNHLDIGSREALESALDAYEGTVIAVSHDRYFIDRVATRIIELDSNEENGHINYSVDSVNVSVYSDFVEFRRNLRLRKKNENGEPEKPAPSAAKLSYEETKRANAERRARERAIARAEKRLPVAEAELEALDAEMLGDAATDYVRLSALSEKKEKLEAEILELYELLM